MKRLPLIAAIATFVIHLVANPHYGYFRDELYFIICGMRPQFGYVDQPPLVPLLAALTQVFGHSLLLLRAVPALFAAGGVFVTCTLVTEFGGGRFAALLAALVFFFTPVLLSFGMKVGTDEVGLLTWPLLVLLLVRLVRGADPKLWIAVGVLAGMSLESKYSIAFLLVALLAGLAAGNERRILVNRWAVAGIAVALVLALPNFIWQARNGFPMIELLRNGQLNKNELPSPALYIAQQLIITNILLAAQWCIGLVWTLRSRQFRWIGIAYLVLIGEMIVFHGKHYYPADFYPVIIAAGAIPIEAWMRRSPTVRTLTLAYVLIAGAIFVPEALPVLTESQYVAYTRTTGAVFHLSKKLTETEHGREDSLLSADWADMHGWPEMAAAVATAYHALASNERARTIVFAGNYGEASAVAFFAPDVPVISEHNQFWLWGTHGFTGDRFIQINGSCFSSDHLFASRQRLATLHAVYAISYEAHAPIWLCRGLRRPLATVWPEIKDFE